MLQLVPQSTSVTSTELHSLRALSLSLSPTPHPPHSHPHTHTVCRDAAFVLDYNLEQAMRVSQPGCGTLVLRGTTPRHLSGMPSYPSVLARVPPLHPPLALSKQHIRSTSVGDAPPHIALRVVVGSLTRGTGPWWRATLVYFSHCLAQLWWTCVSVCCVL